ncbi:MAG: radical SAM protein, partial [Phycisphaerae bacterium]|nr:radical SAM protein [Phycisphaerae bacterium]
MTHSGDPTNPQDFFGLLPAEIDAVVTAAGSPAFRGRQLRDWVYRKLTTDPTAMSNLPQADRQHLTRWFRFESAELVSRQDSRDGTIKLLLRWPDGAAAETVMIPDGPRRTACVSSQVGCPVGCRFCASGLDGLRGNLSAARIVEQVFHLNRLLDSSDEGAPGGGEPSVPDPCGADRPGRRRKAPPHPHRITNIVFMGMGEPLANYPAVMRAVRILHDPQCFNLGARRMTISTVGLPSRIRDLAEEQLPLNLALSLHAPTEELRRQLIPWASHFNLEEILEACRYYFRRTGREITLEYILLAGVNDQPGHARQLAKLCRSVRANVNLIRYNEVESLPYRRPTARDVMAFQQILRDAGINTHVRKSRGRDIDAACGQLRRRQAAPPAPSNHENGRWGWRGQEATHQGTAAREASAPPASGVSGRGFTLIELLVLLAIGAILLSIFIPYALKLREENRRIECRDRLRQMFVALQSYAADHASLFPQTRYDPAQPLTVFASADAANNVTSALWLLVSLDYVPDTEVFLCPGVGGTPAPK